MFRNKGGEIDTGAFTIAEKLRRAVGFDDFVLAARKDGNVEADDIERTFLERLVDEDDFFWGERTVANDFNLAAGFAALDAGLVENVAANDIDAKLLLNIEELLDNPAVVESAVFEVKEDVFCALGDARLSEVAPGDEFVLAGKPSGWIEIFVGFGLEIFILELKDVLEASDMINDLSILVLSDELVDMERVGLILRVVEGIAEIDQVRRVRNDGFIIKAHRPAGLEEKVERSVGVGGIEEFRALGLGMARRGVGGGHGYFSIYF